MRQLKKVCVFNSQKRPSDSEVQISHFVRNNRASACFRGQGAKRLLEAACSHPDLLYEKRVCQPDERRVLFRSRGILSVTEA